MNTKTIKNLQSILDVHKPVRRIRIITAVLDIFREDACKPPNKGDRVTLIEVV